MRKLTILTGAALLAVGVPAAAQWGYSFYQDRIERLSDRLETSVRDGRISQREAYRLRYELRNLRLVERGHSRGGFSQPERQELQQRIDSLDRRIRDAIGDRDWRDRRDGRGYDRDDDSYDDRYDRDGDGYSDTYDRDRDGYDDRYDRNRDGYGDRYDQDRDGYDDRYERDRGMDPNDAVSNRRYGPGDQLPSSYNNYNVPVEYQSRYRDNARYQYRYDGRAIYEVDRRTGRITRVIEAR